jgi:hypothetical protein
MKDLQVVFWCTAFPLVAVPLQAQSGCKSHYCIAAGRIGGRTVPCASRRLTGQRDCSSRLDRQR